MVSALLPLIMYQAVTSVYILLHAFMHNILIYFHTIAQLLM